MFSRTALQCSGCPENTKDQHTFTLDAIDDQMITYSPRTRGSHAGVVRISLAAPQMSPLSRRTLLGGKADASARLHALGKFTHGFARDDAGIAPGKRSFSLIDSGKNFRPAALALFPQRKCFPDGVFLAPKASTFNSLADKRFGSELSCTSLCLQRRRRRRGVKRQRLYSLLPLRARSRSRPPRFPQRRRQ